MTPFVAIFLAIVLVVVLLNLLFFIIPAMRFVITDAGSKIRNAFHFWAAIRTAPHRDDAGGHEGAKGSRR
jgi:hypothetical protein